MLPSPHPLCTAYFFTDTHEHTHTHIRTSAHTHTHINTSTHICEQKMTWLLLYTIGSYPLLASWPPPGSGYYLSWKGLGEKKGGGVARVVPCNDENMAARRAMKIFEPFPPNFAASCCNARVLLQFYQMIIHWRREEGRIRKLR